MIQQIAFSMVKGTDATVARAMMDNGVSVDDFFSLTPVSFADAVGMSRNHVIQRSHMEEALTKARQEMRFIESHNIRTLSIFDANYPRRLAECHDAPTMLYILGNANLSPDKIISIVGTRKPTAYGAASCNGIIESLAETDNDITVTSGLAYGIDALAHTAALDNNLPTIGILAHGLQMIYPAAHRDLAKRILNAGGALISEYPSGVKPYRGNFLERNRIVAGLSDATLIVESDIKGGAMSTANIAFSYDREVFAIPGKTTDRMSSGCNMLIHKNKAALTMGASDIINAMGWSKTSRHTTLESQPSLFEPQLNDIQQHIYDIIRQSNSYIGVDRLNAETDKPVSELLPILFELEMEGLIVKAPGNRYAPA